MELWIEWIIKGFVLAFAILTGFAYLTLYERRALARIQVRIGPNPRGRKGCCSQWQMRLS